MDHGEKHCVFRLRFGQVPRLNNKCASVLIQLRGWAQSPYVIAAARRKRSLMARPNPVSGKDSATTN